MSDPITFYAQIAKVQTLADGGLRFTFDAPEFAIMAAAELMAFKQHGIVVDVVVTARLSEEPVEQVGTRSDAKSNRKGRLDKGSKRQPKWTTEEQQGTDDDPESSGQQGA